MKAAMLVLLLTGCACHSPAYTAAQRIVSVDAPLHIDGREARKLVECRAGEFLVGARVGR